MPDTDLATQADGIAAPSEPAETRWGKISRNPNTINAIFALLKAGKTQTDIANSLGITQSAVSKVIDKYEPRDELAVRRAKALSLAMVESLKRSAINGEKAGRHGAASAVLQAAKVLGGEGESGPRVVVQIGVRDSDVQFRDAQTAYPTDQLSDSGLPSLLAPIHGAPVTD